MGGPNLEVFKFGMYILFPIASMWYFGTNLDDRFSVPGFWPSESQRGTIPTDPDEIDSELARIRAKNARYRQQQLQQTQAADVNGLDSNPRHPSVSIADQITRRESAGPAVSQAEAEQKRRMAMVEEVKQNLARRQ